LAKGKDTSSPEPADAERKERHDAAPPVEACRLVAEEEEARRDAYWGRLQFKSVAERDEWAARALRYLSAPSVETLRPIQELNRTIGRENGAAVERPRHEGNQEHGGPPEKAAGRDRM